MLDLEAMWIAEFSSNLGMLGTGIIVLETLRAFGGDAQYYYIGDYQVDNGNVTASVTVTHYHGTPLSIAGPIKQFTAKIAGKHTEPVFYLQGSVVEYPQIKLNVKLTKLALLP